MLSNAHIIENCMKSLDFLDLFLWTFRRNEKDVIHLYDYLSDVMKLTTGGTMLNFGYWKNSDFPTDAQKNLCDIFGKISQLKAGQKVIDVGSGYGMPASMWNIDYNLDDVICLDINFEQLKKSKNSTNKRINSMNATATFLPFKNCSIDRILAFESAQHFKPLENFVFASYQILKNNGLLSIAIPVVSKNFFILPVKLGILSMTWSSEHYTANYVKSTLEKYFKIIEQRFVGLDVYEPLAHYYITNRDLIKTRIIKQYPAYVENILFKSILKMKHLSEKKIIDYLLITCKKQVGKY